MSSQKPCLSLTTGMSTCLPCCSTRDPTPRWPRHTRHVRLVWSSHTSCPAQSPCPPQWQPLPRKYNKQTKNEERHCTELHKHHHSSGVQVGKNVIRQCSSFNKTLLPSGSIEWSYSMVDAYCFLSSPPQTPLDLLVAPMDNLKIARRIDHLVHHRHHKFATNLARSFLNQIYPRKPTAYLEASTASGEDQ